MSLEGDGWYFWDETYSQPIGPFPDKWEADKTATWYMMFIDGQFRGSLCPERPEKLIGQPIGQYRCPVCGMMLVAGIPHFPVTDENPDIIRMEEMEDDI